MEENDINNSEADELKSDADELRDILRGWSERNGTPISFKGSGGQLIIHFDKDDNVRLVMVHKVLLKR